MHITCKSVTNQINKLFLTLYGFNFTCKKVFFAAVSVFAFTFFMNNDVSLVGDISIGTCCVQIMN